MRFKEVALVLTILLMCSQQARATTVRYALIIGNNAGVNKDKNEPFPRLKHAEREVKRLHNRLIKVANFERSGRRTQLITGASKKEVEKAVKILARQRRTDKKNIPNLQSIFLFYFTGHGQNENLLLEDGPLSQERIGTLINEVAADLTIGIVDACFSGSLSLKGVKPTLGKNFINELPEAVNSTEGKIFYFSSGADEPSYEDPVVGGVFTHYFTEGLTKAVSSGPGITLNEIWSYASENTRNHTAKHDREQTPLLRILQFESKDPIFFSFPTAPASTLYLAESISGNFYMSYNNGMRLPFSKRKNRKKKIKVYPGKGKIWMRKSERVQLVQDFNLNANETLELQASGDTLQSLAVGEKRVSYSSKGEKKRHPIKRTKVTAGTTLLPGASYERLEVISPTMIPANRISPLLRLDHGMYNVAASVGYAWENVDYSAWGYRTKGVTGAVSVGRGVIRGSTKVSLGGLFQFNYAFQKFENEHERHGTGYLPACYIGILLPRHANIVFDVQSFFGGMYSKGEAMNSGFKWSLAGGASVSILFKTV